MSSPERGVWFLGLAISLATAALLMLAFPPAAEAVNPQPIAFFRTGYSPAPPPSGDPVAALLATMSEGQFKRIDTGGTGYVAAMEPLTMAVYNGATNDPATSDSQVASFIGGADIVDAMAYSAPAVNGTDLKICSLGGGHAGSARNPVMCFDARAAITSIQNSQTPTGWYEGRKTGATLSCADAEPGWSFQQGCQSDIGTGGSWGGWQSASNVDGSHGICASHSYTTNVAITGTDYFTFGGWVCFLAGHSNPGAGEVFNAATKTSILYHSAQTVMYFGTPVTATYLGLVGVDGSNGGPFSACYDHYDGKLYTGLNQTGSVILASWSSGFTSGSSTLNQVTTAGTGGLQSHGFPCLIIQDPATVGKRDFVQMNCPNLSTPNPSGCTSNQFSIVTDIESGGSPSTITAGTLASYPASYPTSGYRPDLMAWCTDDYSIYNWPGGGHVYKLTPQSSLSAWTFAEAAPSYSGDIPAMVSTANGGSCAKLDNYNAMILAEPDATNNTMAVYLFKLPWPTQATITHANGTTTAYSTLNSACSSLVTTDRRLQVPNGRVSDYCVIPQMTFSAALLFDGFPPQFKDQNGNNPDVTGLPVFDVVHNSGSAIGYIPAPDGNALMEDSATNVTFRNIEVDPNGFWTIGWDDAGAMRLGTGLTGVGGSVMTNTSFDHVAMHDMNMVLQSQGPNGTIAIQNSAFFSSVADGGTLAHILYIGSNSEGNCTSLSLTNSTVRDVGSSSLSPTGGYGEGHAIKSRCLSTTLTHSIAAVRGNPWYAGCDAGLDALEVPDGGSLSVSHSVLQSSPCDGNADVIRLDAELWGDTTSFPYDEAEGLISQLELNFTITGTVTSGSDTITGISSGDMALLDARNFASGPNDEQALYFGPTPSDFTANGQLWSFAVRGSGGCGSTSGDPFARSALWYHKVSSSSIQVKCFDNSNGFQSTTAARSGTISIQVQLFGPYSGRTHSNSISNSIIINEKNENPQSDPAQVAVWTRSPAQVTATSVTIVGNPNMGAGLCWGSNNSSGCSSSQWSGAYFGGPPAPMPPVASATDPCVGTYCFIPANFPWSSTAQQIIDTGTTKYTSRSLAQTGGLFAGVNCTPSSYTCLPLPP